MLILFIIWTTLSLIIPNLQIYWPSSKREMATSSSHFNILDQNIEFLVLDTFSSCSCEQIQSCPLVWFFMLKIPTILAGSGFFFFFFKISFTFFYIRALSLLRRFLSLKPSHPRRRNRREINNNSNKTFSQVYLYILHNFFISLQSPLSSPLVFRKPKNLNRRKWRNQWLNRRRQMKKRHRHSSWRSEIEYQVQMRYISSLWAFG